MGHEHEVSSPTEEQLSLSTTIIQDIFSSLTITEKCALAISIGHASASVQQQQQFQGQGQNDTAFYISSLLQQKQKQNDSYTMENNGVIFNSDNSMHRKSNSINSDPINLLNQELLSVSQHSNAMTETSLPLLNYDILSISHHSNSVNSNTGSDYLSFTSSRFNARFPYSKSSLGGLGGTSNLSVNTESVIDELLPTTTENVNEMNNKFENEKQLLSLENDINTISNRESLDVVMRMMGENELSQIENEVYIILIFYIMTEYNDIYS